MNSSEEPLLLPGPWIAVPLETVRQQYKEHERDTARPEAFDGVALVRNRPPADADIEIVCTISPSRKARNDEPMPCHICGNSKKFYANDGYLVRWNGHLYFAGPVCGRAYHGETFTKKVSEFDQSEAERLAERSIASRFLEKSQWLESGRRLLSLSDRVDLARSSFFAGTATVRRELRRMHEVYDGQLMIEFSIPQPSQEGGGSRMVTELRPIARMVGLDHLRPTSATLKKRCAEAVDALSYTFRGCEDESSLSRRILSLRDSNRLLITEQQMRKAISALRGVRDAVIASQVFYSDKNWRALKEWADHPYRPIRARVWIDKNSRCLEDQISGRSSKPFDVAGICTASIPTLPD